MNEYALHLYVWVEDGDGDIIPMDIGDAKDDIGEVMELINEIGPIEER